jgi:hypothetical protein
MDLLDYHSEKRIYPGSTHPTNDGTTPTGRATTLLLAGLSAPKTFCAKMVWKKAIKKSPQIGDFTVQ